MLDIKHIFFRMILAALIAGIIGYEREYKNRPAGIRTHMLVCLGATIIAMIQVQISIEALELAKNSAHLGSVVRSDPARLIAQVISGIGFLGAGTIIVHKSSVTGLTTAASLWTCAGLGLAAGMGYYNIAVIGCFGVFSALFIVKRVISFPDVKTLEIEYSNENKTKEILNDYFYSANIQIRDKNISVEIKDGKKIYKTTYILALKGEQCYANIVEDLAKISGITYLKIIGE